MSANKPRVLTVYNAYLNRGGEDEVFEAEADLLENRGHEVRRFRVEPDSLRSPKPAAWPGLALQTIWSADHHRLVRKMVAGFRPDIVHFHNTFPLLSPSVYSASRLEGAAVVQTLHNYRLLCPQANFFRDGRPCEDCKQLVFPWPAIKHACYHDSRLRSSVVAAMIGIHNARRTWHRDVDLFITPSEIARRKFIEGGISPGHIVAKPNFIIAESIPSQERDDFFLYAGRLSAQKGVLTMVEAWSRLSSDVPLRVIGDGPMAGDVERLAKSCPAVEYLGRREHKEVLKQMGRARALLFPSMWNETFGLTVLEAFSQGTPVIASRIGQPGLEMVRDDETGMTFNPGDAEGLAARVRWFQEHPREAANLGRTARTEYETQYSAERNYELLLDAYAKATEISAARRNTSATQDMGQKW